MEDMILRLYKRIDEKGRLSIPNTVIGSLKIKTLEIKEEDHYVVILISENGTKKLDEKNRISLTKKVLDRLATNEVYMEVYQDHLRLIPIKFKGGKI